MEKEKGKRIRLKMYSPPLIVQLVKNLPAIRRPQFNSWVEKTPGGRERLPTTVFWPGEFHGLYSPWSLKESGMNEQLSLSSHPNFFFFFFLAKPCSLWDLNSLTRG